MIIFTPMAALKLNMPMRLCLFTNKLFDFIYIQPVQWMPFNFRASPFFFFWVFNSLHVFFLPVRVSLKDLYLCSQGYLVENAKFKTTVKNKYGAFLHIKTTHCALFFLDLFFCCCWCCFLLLFFTMYGSIQF